MSVVVLAGGTGGAKLARGMLDVVGAAELVVVANTGDDIEIYGAYVSPDPDLVTLWLADRIDERGWGITGDTFEVMNALRQLGQNIWFNLGDRDLAMCLARAEALKRGRTLTDAHSEICAALGVEARVLPMSDHPVRTRVRAQDRWWSFQEFMVQAQGGGPVQGVEFRGARAAPPTPQVLEAIEAAQAIVIGPSNPIISIGPILALPGSRDALAASRAPVVAVSPLVAGSVIKGPTEPFLEWAGQPLSSAGIAALYEGVIQGLVADQTTDALPVHVTDVLMDEPQARTRVASEALRFALSLH